MPEPSTPRRPFSVWLFIILLVLLSLGALAGELPGRLTLPGFLHPRPDPVYLVGDLPALGGI